MSNWAQILALPEAFQRRILSIYDHNQSFFPIEVRKSLADWIESQDWSFYSNPNFSYDNNFLEKCVRLLQAFVEQVNQLLAVTQDISDKFKIDNFQNTLQLSIDQNNYEIIKHVYECLRNENVIIQRYQEVCILGLGDLQNLLLMVNYIELFFNFLYFLGYEWAQP